ncbi:MAG TPA: universal stress protein, partial [Bacteroidia bacterium]|nr:universal stress protein [Bacteroidia bacterium]
TTFFYGGGIQTVEQAKEMAQVPLIHLTSDKKEMGAFVNKRWVTVLAWGIAGIIISLNGGLVYNTIVDWIKTSENPMAIYFTVIPPVIAAAVLLMYIIFRPFIKKLSFSTVFTGPDSPEALQLIHPSAYNRIAVTVDFSPSDSKAISNAISLGGKDATYLLIHIVETAGARVFDQEIDDQETNTDKTNLKKYQADLESKGYSVEISLGFGNPKKSIPEIVNGSGCDLLVMGAHGHKALKDFILGTTLDKVRHNVKVPVFIVK